jgi:hypothetical protein
MVSVVVAASTGLVLTGLTVLTNGEETADMEVKAGTLVTFSDVVDHVASGDVQSQHVQFNGYSGSGGARVVDDGQMRVELRDPETGEVDTVVLEHDLGGVEYRNDGRRIAYQSGGVWRSNEMGDPGLNASNRLTDPSVAYTEGTVTVAAIEVRPETIDSVITTGTTVTRIEGSTAYPTVDNASLQNPVENATVTILVQSEYYRAWGAYFESEFPPDSNAVVMYENEVSGVMVQVPGNDVFLHVSNTTVVVE